MRIIHTSDWHLGQSFFGKSRAAEHQAFLYWLTGQIAKYQVNALIVTGDIFDSGTPPSYARELYNHFVVQLQASSCQLVILAGNHDSVATLNESRELFAHLNTRIIAGTTGNLQQQLLILKDDQGLPGALLCAVPFLRARDMVSSHAGESGIKKQQNLQQAIAQHYQALYQMALARRTALGLPLPIIASGHLTTVGASLSDSVRDIYIGALDAFPATAFPPADYIALGHIHRAQRVAGFEHIRYSGSPISLSFDESGTHKTVFLVEFVQQALRSVSALPIPCWQPMQLIKGTLQQIEQQIKQQIEQQFSLVSSQQGLPAIWLNIEVETQEWLPDIQCRIHAMVTGLPVEVVLLRRSQQQRRQGLQWATKETLKELSITDVFERRLAQEENSDEQRQKRVRQLFAEMVAEAGQESDSV